MGELDLIALFGRKAKAMLLSIEEGRAAHKANNIKASGAPFEEQFRRLLAESLPSTSKVASGYFYGASSRCSGEIDVLVYEDKESFRLDPAPQEQHYVPYTSVSILGQIRNSARDLPGAIEQVQQSLRSWHEMNQEMAASRITNTPYQERPLTLIVCGDCDEKHLKKLGGILEEKGSPYADYILLLDRGEVVAGDLDFIEYDKPHIDFLQYRNVNSMHLCKPDGPSNDTQGVALLWLYFALVSKLNWDQGNNLRYHAFCRQISALYPLRPTKRLL
jgi:hypothetical protein